MKQDFKKTYKFKSCVNHDVAHGLGREQRSLEMFVPH